MLKIGAVMVVHTRSFVDENFNSAYWLTTSNQVCMIMLIICRDSEYWFIGLAWHTTRLSGRLLDFRRRHTDSGCPIHPITSSNWCRTVIYFNRATVVSQHLNQLTQRFIFLQQFLVHDPTDRRS
jgi:hypothetical protein